MSVMLTKFESKSNRVKGMCEASLYQAHSTNSYIQDSHFILHNPFSPQRFTMVVCSCGIIAWVFWLIDSRSMKVSPLNTCGVSHSHDFYTGPVRGVAIHPSRALLVTGGDDYKIRVWGQVTWRSQKTYSLMFYRYSTPK